MGAQLEALHGESPRIVAIRAQVGNCSPVRPARGACPPLLILGETGTGKGLLARTFHEAGPRRDSALSTSTVPRSPRPCSKPSYSATSAAPSPTPATPNPASSRLRTAARCSSTRSDCCPLLSRASFSPPSRTAVSVASAARAQSPSTSCSSRRPASISARPSPTGAFARTSTIGWPYHARAAPAARTRQ